MPQQQSLALLTKNDAMKTVGIDLELSYHLMSKRACCFHAAAEGVAVAVAVAVAGTVVAGTVVVGTGTVVVGTGTVVAGTVVAGTVVAVVAVAAVAAVAHDVTPFGS